MIYKLQLIKRFVICARQLKVHASKSKMKLHAIFAVVFTSALLLELSSAQCDTPSIITWSQNNLMLQCQLQLGLFNTIPTPQNMAQWTSAGDYVCTTDSCGGALYRYLLTSCNFFESNDTGRLQNISLAVGLQNQCSNGTSTGDRCHCGDPVSTVPGAPSTDNSLLCRRNISLDDLAACAPLQQNPNMSCPDDCQAALRNLGGYLGCCFNSIFNTPLSPLNGVLMGAENPALWGLCGVPYPASRCPDLLSATPLPTTPATTTVMPTTAGSDATAASKTVIGLLLALAFIKTIF